MSRGILSSPRNHGQQEMLIGAHKGPFKTRILDICPATRCPRCVDEEPDGG